MRGKIIILSTPRLNNLVAMIIGIISSQSVVLSKIFQKLKFCYSLSNMILQSQQLIVGLKM